MRALVFGAGGMLGRALVEELKVRGAEVDAILHAEADIAEWLSVIDVLGRHEAPDVVFNAAGVLNTARPGVGMVRTNALGPHVLAEVLAVDRRPLIHISTDCVFSGRSERWAPTRHGYSTVHIPDAVDLYGRTKLVGEVDAHHVTNVRTSFVGPDHGLWAWVIAQAGARARVEGWTKALWSGSTVWAVAEGLVDIAMHRPSPSGALLLQKIPGGIVHLATEKPVSKHDAIRNIAFAEQVDLDVIEDHQVVIDRTLHPTHPLESLEAALERRHS